MPFLGIGLPYTVTAAFTLARCVRDHQESSAVVQRVDQARLDRLRTEHDPFRAWSGAFRGRRGSLPGAFAWMIGYVTSATTRPDGYLAVWFTAARRP